VPLASHNAGAAITCRIGDAPDQRYDGTPVRLTGTAVLTASVSAPGFAMPATRTLAFTRVEPRLLAPARGVCRLWLDG
jgi:hypothetical protein